MAEYIDDLKKNGYAVIKNVIPKKICDKIMDKLITSLETISPELDRNDIKTWKRENLPPQTKIGLFQNFLGQHSIVERVRNSRRIKRIWENIHKDLTGEEDLICSVDGVNIKPSTIGPYHKPDKDWAHLDQFKGDPFSCVQGQLVLTNTTASFVCSPKSHLLFSETSKMLDEKKWLIKDVEKCKKLVEENGGEWQVPIYVEAGSVIVWFSSLVHSAKYQDGVETSEDDFWHGWRGVIYLCYTPKSNYTESQLKKIEKYKKEKRCMGHNNARVCPKNMAWRINYKPEIQKYIDNPELFQF